MSSTRGPLTMYGPSSGVALGRASAGAANDTTTAVAMATAAIARRRLFDIHAFYESLANRYNPGRPFALGQIPRGVRPTLVDGPEWAMLRWASVDARWVDGCVPVPLEPSFDRDVFSSACWFRK